MIQTIENECVRFSRKSRRSCHPLGESNWTARLCRERVVFNPVQSPKPGLQNTHAHFSRGWVASKLSTHLMIINKLYAQLNASVRSRHTVWTCRFFKIWQDWLLRTPLSFLNTLSSEQCGSLLADCKRTAQTRSSTLMVRPISCSLSTRPFSDSPF